LLAKSGTASPFLYFVDCAAPYDGSSSAIKATAPTALAAHTILETLRKFVTGQFSRFRGT
jgi:hypothetical protein